MKKLKHLIITACFIILNVLPITMVATTNPTNLPPTKETVVSRREENIATYDIAIITEEIREKLKEYIANARIKYLFKILKYIIQSNTTISNEVYLLNYRFSSLEKSVANGLISNERATIIANQIVFNLLALIDKINILDIHSFL